MESLEESVITAMDGKQQTELFPFLPYILQDFWEIGADPDAIINMIKKHATKPAHEIRVLDLGCGKGAVCVQLAHAVGCTCLGIDAVEAFITYADEKASEMNVSHLCQFEVNDIRVRINTLNNFDFIILGAIGTVFGSMFETITATKNALSPGGLIIIDDGYIPDNSHFKHPLVSSKSEIIDDINKAGMQLADELIHQIDSEAKALHKNELRFLENRCKELIEKYPDKRTIFEAYISNQKNEYEAIENDFVNSLMVIA